MTGKCGDKQVFHLRSSLQQFLIIFLVHSCSYIGAGPVIENDHLCSICVCVYLDHCN